MNPTLGTILRLARHGRPLELASRGHVWLRRRFYRLLAPLQRLRTEIEIPDPPRALIAGCVYRIHALVRNRSRVAINAGRRTPRFAAALSLQLPDGAIVEQRHTLFPASLRPGDTTSLDLLIDVPRRIGDAQLSLDVVRESCFWFSEIGQPPAATPVHITVHDDARIAEPALCLDVTLDITNRCPLRCIQCRKSVRESPDDQGEMSRGLYERIAADLFPRTRSLLLSSAGEPLMAGYLTEALALARARGVVDLGFTTSGLLLDRRRAEQLVALGIDRIEFSLDGASPAVYNAIRIRSDFEHVVGNIRFLAAERRRRRTTRPLIRLNFVMMRRNVHELPDLIDLAARLDAEEVLCQHLLVFTPALREEALVFHKERSNQAVEEAQRRAHRHGIRLFHPPLFATGDVHSSITPPPPAEAGTQPLPPCAGQAGIWAADDSGTSSSRKSRVDRFGIWPTCTDPWRKVYLDWQGLVYPCCAWREEPLGDLRQSSFDDVWRSERYRRLRAGLLSGPLGPSCAVCSAITGGDLDDERSYILLDQDTDRVSASEGSRTGTTLPA